MGPIIVALPALFLLMVVPPAHAECDYQNKVFVDSCGRFYRSNAASQIEDWAKAMGWHNGNDQTRMVCLSQFGTKKIYWLNDNNGSICNKMAKFLNAIDNTIKVECLLGDYYGRKVAAGFQSAAGKCDAMEALINTAMADPCKYQDCDNKGTCAKDGAEGGYSCSCSSGNANFGKTCVTDSCADNQCIAGNTKSCVLTGTSGGSGYTCDCKDGWEGEFCQTDIDGCTGQSCNNRGICSDVAAGGDTAYTCSCTDPNFWGPTCEYIKNSCASGDECNGHGTCNSCTSANQPGDLASAECCLVGPCADSYQSWSQSICNWKDEPCAKFPELLASDNTLADFKIKTFIESFPHYGWKTKEKIFMGCMAQCMNQMFPGYGGPGSFYEVREIAFDASAKAAMFAAPKFTCDCNDGHLGRRCEVDVNECDGHSKCGTNGACIDGDGMFSCKCNAGFSGEFCQVNDDDCADVDCGISGKCIDDIDAYECVCTDGWGKDTSGLCSVKLQHCVNAEDGTPPCNNNGECSNDVSMQTYKCTCNTNWTGKDCDVNLCASVDCGTHGTCNAGVCECESENWAGKDCDVNLCASVDCGTHGTCNAGRCECESEYYFGVSCELTVCDKCGVCDDDMSNDCQMDCNGEFGGSAYVDDCGTCVQDTGKACTRDCNGEFGGSAYVDDCGTCVQDTGKACTRDCNGEFGGSAYVDDCGTCVQGSDMACVVEEATKDCDCAIIMSQYCMEFCSVTTKDESTIGDQTENPDDTDQHLTDLVTNLASALNQAGITPTWTEPLTYVLFNTLKSSGVESVMNSMGNELDLSKILADPDITMHLSMEGIDTTPLLEVAGSMGGGSSPGSQSGAGTSLHSVAAVVSAACVLSVTTAVLA